jgi:hypothetical protein
LSAFSTACWEWKPTTSSACSGVSRERLGGC